jgi:hypothetical protein
MSGAAATTDEAILVTPDQVSWSDSPVIPNAKGAYDAYTFRSGPPPCARQPARR